MKKRQILYIRAWSLMAMAVVAAAALVMNGAGGSGTDLGANVTTGETFTMQDPYDVNSDRSTYETDDMITVSAFRSISGDYVPHETFLSVQIKFSTTSDFSSPFYFTDFSTSNELISYTFPASNLQGPGTYQFCVQTSSNGGQQSNCVIGTPINVIADLAVDNSASTGSTASEKQVGESGRYSVGEWCTSNTVSCTGSDGDSFTCHEMGYACPVVGTAGGSINIGETGHYSAGDWCNNGSSCPDAEGSDSFTCIDSSQTCSTWGTGTSGASLGIGATGSYNAGDWCSDGHSCPVSYGSDSFTCLEHSETCFTWDDGTVGPDDGTTGPTGTATGGHQLEMGESGSYSAGDWCGSSSNSCPVSYGSDGFTCIDFSATCNTWDSEDGTVETEGEDDATTTGTATNPDGTVPPGTVTYGQCAPGEICSSDSWCNNGRMCHYPDGTLTCSNGWDGAGSECPAETSVCSPWDEYCTEPGEVRSLNAGSHSGGWCMDGRACYSDTELYCQPWDYNGETQCPASHPSTCAPDDPFCANPGEIVPMDNWCSDSFECYSDSRPNEKYCQPWDYSYEVAASFTGGFYSNQCTHPEFSSQCRPDDPYCLEVGETGSSDSWCAGAANSCYNADGTLTCIEAGGVCEAGAGACRPGDFNCIEPNAIGPRDGWCGGHNSVHCYSNDGANLFCGEMDSNNPFAWDSYQCPSDFGRCWPDDEYCLEVGETGPSTHWCSAGYPEWNADGSITCVADFSLITPPPTEVVCTQVITPAYDPSSGACEEFSTPCNVPEGWLDVPAGQICGSDGVVKDIDEDFDWDIEIAIGNDLQYLEDIKFQLLEVEISDARIEGLLRVIDETIERLYELAKANITGSDIREKYKDLHHNEMVDIANKMNAVQPHIDFEFLRRDLKWEIADYEVILAELGPGHELYQSLDPLVKRLKVQLEAGETQKGEALSRTVSALYETRQSIEVILDGSREDATSDFVKDAIVELEMDRIAFREFIASAGIDDHQLDFMMAEFDGVLHELLALETDVYNDAIYGLVDDGFWLRDRIEFWLSGYGYARAESEVKINEILTYVEDRVAEKVNEILDKVTNKLVIALNEKLQDVAVKVADLMDEKFSNDFEPRITQALSNLTHVVEEHRDKIVEAKSQILESVDDMKRLAQEKLTAFAERELSDMLEMVAERNLCGSVAEEIQKEINSAGLALEIGELDVNDVIALKEEVVATLAKNDRECYEVGAAHFWDTPTHEWWFESAQRNFDEGWVTGFRDANGNLTGEYGSSNPALRAEIMAMILRLWGVPEVNAGSLDVDIPGVPEWAYGYANAWVAKGIPYDRSLPLDGAITRIEAAEMLYQAILVLSPGYVEVPTEFSSAASYGDYSEFSGDASGVRAVEALTDLGVFKGSGGDFKPYNPYPRSEFGTVNQRVAETPGLL